MIYFLVRDDNFTPIQDYLRNWGGPIERHFYLMAYEDMPSPSRLKNGTFIFTDVERLPDRMAVAATTLWETLAKRGNAVRLVNHPTRSLRRYDLLRTLHTLGWNRFNVYRLEEPRDTLRYPVFVRHTSEHHGTYTPLLADAQALEDAIASLTAQGHQQDDLIIVEFLDTSDEGFYRKYSAMCANGRILAHHIMFKREWHVKAPSLDEPHMIAAERAFQESNPHEAQLREIFQLARIDFGRIDYGVLDGQIQVWEINSNPTILAARDFYLPSQMPAKIWFSDALNQAFCEWDDKSPPCSPYFINTHLLRHDLRLLPQRAQRRIRLFKAGWERLTAPVYIRASR